MDLIIYNSNIHTFCKQNQQFQAIAIKKDKIAALGSNQEMLQLKGKNTKIIDANSKIMLPGFIDSHLHLLEGAERLFHIKLKPAKSKKEFIEFFSREVKNYKKGEWILGGDWNHENWGGELPDRDWIDSITPENPVWVKRLDGHMGLANTLALTISGIIHMKGQVNGGELIYRNGALSGIFKDRAMELIEKHIPEKSATDTEKYLLKAQEYLSQRGVTSAHYLNLFDTIDMNFLESIKNQEKLRLRLYLSFPLTEFEALEAHISENGRGDDLIRYGILKAFIDGSLGSQTAAFFSNYKNSDRNGLFVTDMQQLERHAIQADSKGLQLAVHAIGDRANHMALNLLQNLVKRNGKRDRRFRIEHAQHLQQIDITRFAESGAIASMQPLHLADDGCWAHKILDQNVLKGSYAFHGLLETNTMLAFGSDWFVSEPSPILGIHAAVNRNTLDGLHPQGWLPEQKISVYEAIKAYTINAAYASFEENIKGSLSVGKLADLVILDKNIVEIEPGDIRNTKVLMTILGGKIIYNS
jgi:predicted amidohydrolase YtcJ